MFNKFYLYRTDVIDNTFILAIFVIIAVNGQNDPCPSSALIQPFQKARASLPPNGASGW